MIAETNAETRALSFLMRERVLAGSGGPRVTVRACRGRDPRAQTGGAGDRAGRPAADRRAALGEAALQRHGAHRAGGGGAPASRTGRRAPGVDPGAHRSRAYRSTFHHDEIRDYPRPGAAGLRLRADDYASAQGLTVDRCFLLANQRPSRETIYPAATRHRDRLDIYVDRKPVEAAIRERRSEDTEGDPVTDDEIAAHLARAWSRERRKEAAGDYMTPGMREAVFDPSPRAAATEPARDAPGWVAANDAGGRCAVGPCAPHPLRRDRGPARGDGGGSGPGMPRAQQIARGMGREAGRTEGNAAVALESRVPGRSQDGGRGAACGQAVSQGRSSFTGVCSRSAAGSPQSRSRRAGGPSQAGAFHPRHVAR